MSTPTATAVPALDALPAVCLGCGCLCDDVEIRAEAGRIEADTGGCTPGQTWFREVSAVVSGPSAWIEGVDTSPDAALDRAAAILLAARAPLIAGLAGLTVEAQRLAVRLADRLGALIDPGRVDPAGWTTLARFGGISASLGEVKNRADVVVFWEADPVTTHPRHLERYSVDPAGRFLDGPRTVLVADRAPSATSARADRFLAVDPARRVETLSALRALVRDRPMDNEAIRASTGLDPEALRRWVEPLRAARYGAWFVGPRLEPAATETLVRLIHDLNLSTRFAMLGLGEPGNGHGAEAVLTWQAGSPGPVDFRSGHPESYPGETSAEARLERGEADAVLMLDDHPAGFLSDDALRALAGLPRVVVGPRATRFPCPWTVALASAVVGLETPGTVFRVDGVPLPLAVARRATFPTHEWWLSGLIERVERPRGGS